jgi:hypothetical protein
MARPKLYAEMVTITPTPVIIRDSNGKYLTEFSKEQFLRHVGKMAPGDYREIEIKIGRRARRGMIIVDYKALTRQIEKLHVLIYRAGNGDPDFDGVMYLLEAIEQERPLDAAVPEKEAGT